MTLSTASNGSVPRLLRSMRAAHQRSSEEWTRRMEVPAGHGPRRRL